MTSNTVYTKWALVTDEALIEMLARVVASEFSGIHPDHVTPEAIDIEFGKRALEFIRTDVDDYLGIPRSP